MKYRTFQPQFHEPIRKLIKTSTIRGSTWVNVGERFALRHWLGSPYRSKMGWLGTAVCAQVASITISMDALPSTVEISIDGSHLSFDEFISLAHQEGFSNTYAMGQWFDGSHKMPFSGILTRWDPASFVAGEPS